MDSAQSLAALRGWAAANLGVLVLVVAVAGLAGVAALVAQGRRLRRLQQHYAALSAGVDGRNLEQLLGHHLARIDGAEQQVRALDRRVGELTADAADALQGVGLVRYDAFGDVGGLVSFALAVLDERGDGFVLNSLFAREGSSTYAKAIRGGRSEISLSEEETAAVRQALDRLPAPGRSPG